MIPSPTIATLPVCLSFLTTASLPSGRTPATTSSTPTCAPITFAVRSLSPVSITVLIPIFLSCCIAVGLSCLITSATAIMPTNFPFSVKRSGVFASSESRSTALFMSSVISDCEDINLKLPPRSCESPHLARVTAFARGCSLLFSSEYASERSCFSL